MTTRFFAQAELPLTLHLIALALWVGGAFASRVVSRALKGERDWRLRASLILVCRRLAFWAELPGAALAVGSGVWLVAAEQLYNRGDSTLLQALGGGGSLPIPVWLWVKLGCVAVGLVGTLTAALSLRKAYEAARSSVTAPNAAIEDRFESMRRGHAVAGLLTLAALLGVVVLSAIRPNW